MRTHAEYDPVRQSLECRRRRVVREKRGHHHSLLQQAVPSGCDGSATTRRGACACEADRDRHWWQHDAARRQVSRDHAGSSRQDRRAERLPASHQPHLPGCRATDSYRSKWIAGTARTADSTPGSQPEMMPSRPLENPWTFPLLFCWHVQARIILLAVLVAWREGPLIEN